jgi:hypothetical protein
LLVGAAESAGVPVGGVGPGVNEQIKLTQ